MVKTKRGLIAALIAVIWAITAVLFLIPSVSAADTQQLDISSGDVNITTAGDYTISGTSSTSKITIDCTGTVNLTFNSVNITASYQGIVMDIKKAAVNLELNGSNILQANQDSAVYPAVNLSDGAELHIYDKDNNGSIKIHGTSNYYGGGAAVSGGSLYIHGGDVSLVGGNKIQGDYGKSFDGKVLNISGGSLSFAGGLINSTESGAIAVSSSLTVGSNATLSIPKNGSVDIANGATFTNQGTVVNNGTIKNKGLIKNNGTFNNNGMVVNYGSDSLTGTALIGNQPYTIGTAFTITGNGLIYGDDYTYPADTGVLTILSSKEMTISGTTTKDTIVVAKNVSANITLAGVNIDVSATYGACAFKIEDDSTGNVTITLADGSVNVLKSGEDRAGLQKNGTGSNIGNLAVSGTGKLTANGGDYAAGIGGGYRGSGSNITISKGIVTATGGKYGAGIGGGNGGSGSNITISDGTVTANGGEDAAGIGGGWRGDGSNITISGGTVTVNGGVDGAGIGGGDSGSGSNITISGGTVIATGRYCGSGIGGGSEGSGSNIIISGGTVTAAGGTDSNWGGAGIGGGWKGDGDIIISGGSVKAIAGSNANAIGGGNSKGAVIPTDGSGKNVYLIELPAAANTLTIDGKAYPTNHGTDGKVYVYLTEGKHTFVTDGNSETKSYGKNSDNKLEEIGTAFTVTGDNLIYGTDYTYPASTGVLTILSDKKVTISGSTITDTIVVAKDKNADITLDGVDIDVSGTYGACAFKIEDDSTGNVTITLADGSTNILKSGNSRAGLQKNGSGTDIGKLTISGTGTLTANGGYFGAGIGGGDGCDSSNIMINGETVIANGGYDAAGIGGGRSGAGSNITISGGTVAATGGEDAAGIGGGAFNSGSDITINGGNVTAKGDASGIGSGDGGSGTNIFINSGTVIAIGGDYCPGIGGYEYGSNIKIIGGNVTANGGESGPGIGGGYANGKGSNITISGGTVTATGGDGGAGIGGGYKCEGSDITISGGTVTATGGEDAAGIGGGIWGKGSNIIISGGSVKATANSYANAIGGGYNSNGAVTPTLADKTTPVYLLEIDNPNDETVFIDGKPYSPKNHKAADSTDTKLYAYLTGKDRVVKVGSKEVKFFFDSDTNSFVKLGSDLKITGDNLIYGTDYTYPASTGVLTILSDKKVTISGSTTKDTIVVGQNKNADITLDGVNIDVSTIYYACAFKIEDDSDGNVKITLADGSDNVLKSGEKCAGLQKNGDNGKLTIQGNGKLTVTGGKYAAGIGGNDSSNGSHITISGGIITANGGSDGAGIGGGWGFPSGGCGSDIIISGGSVKATAGSNADAIGGGPFGSGPVTPTNGTEKVYLLELDNPNGKDITINGKAYPTSHGDEKKIYAYLPAKTAADPNTVTVGESTSKYYYDTANSKWYGVADVPDADDTEFIYNGKEQIYAIPESTLYTIDGSKQKTPGDYTVTVALNDKVNNTWSDGTTDDKEYTFTIAKAQLKLTVTAKPTSDIAGKTITVTASAVNPNNTALDDIPDIVLTYRIGDGAEIPFTGSFVIPKDAPIGTVITVKAKTAEDSNYKSSEAETKVNVSDCDHTDVQTEWNSDSTGHWHICNYCSENVDFAAHTYDDWKITVPATEAADGKKEHSCTICGYTEEEAVKYTAAAKAAEEVEKVLDDFIADNDTTAEDIINSITGVIGDDVTAEVTEIKKIPATEDSEGSITVVITITDSDGNTETVEKTFVIGKLPENDKPQNVYYPISINGNVTADRTNAKAGDIVNVSTAFGYDIIVTANGRQIARITEKGSFVMPDSRIYITVVQNDTLAVMSNAWNHAYVYSYDSDMNRIKISSDSKRGTVTIKLGSEYAGREFVIYSGRKSTKVKVTEGALDENGTYSFKADDGRNYTLVIK